MTEEMKPLIYAASEGPLSTAQAISVRYTV